MGIETAMIIAAVAAVGSSVYQATKKPKTPSVPELPKTSAAQIEAEADAKTMTDKRKYNTARSRNKTIFTSPLGGSQATTGRKTLLGE